MESCKPVWPTMHWDSPSIRCGTPYAAGRGTDCRDSAKLRCHAAAFVAGWVVAIVVEGDVSICCLSLKLMFRTSRMGVYALVHPRNVVCFLLLSPS